MLYNVFTDEETWNHKNAVLTINDENAMDRACEQLARFSKNKDYEEDYTYNQK